MARKKKTEARSNGHIQVVPIMFDDGRERHLRFDFNALATIEDLTGINVLDESALTAKVSVKKIIAIMYALLKHEDADLTIEQVGSWLHPGNMAKTLTTLTDAISAGKAPPKANG